MGAFIAGWRVQVLLLGATLLGLTAWPEASAPVRFAIVADYGFPTLEAKSVASMIDSWNPDFVVTAGDNNYFEGNYARQSTYFYDAAVGALYGQYIRYPKGSRSRHAPGAAVNRFFPALGNHDVGHNPIPPNYGFLHWQDYFDLPGNERYYTFVRGNVQVYVLDSDTREPDGITASYGEVQPSKQAAWLKEAMLASTVPWKFVVMHIPPFGSGNYSHGVLRWPFREWGAQAVFSAHGHLYERLSVNGIAHVINGLGGHLIYATNYVEAPGSVLRANAMHGAMLAEVSDYTARFRLFYVDGTILDEFVITRYPAANVLDRAVTVSEDDALEDSAGRVRLVDWQTRLGARQARVTGLRFQALNIPPSARILRAYLQLKARGALDETNEPNYNLPLTLSLRGEIPLDHEARPFTTAARSLSTRPTTQAAVTWDVPTWIQFEEQQPQRTPDLSAILQEVVDHPGWTTGQAFVLLIQKAAKSGRGVRFAYLWDAEPISTECKGGGAPLLHVEWLGPYRLIDLGGPGHGFNSYACSINNNDEVVGYSGSVFPLQRDRAWCWAGSRLARLETSWGVLDSVRALGVNDARLTVGMVDRLGNGSYQWAFRVRPGGDMTTLRGLGGASGALAINEPGVAVGYSRNRFGVERAVWWGKDSTFGREVQSSGVSNPRCRSVANDISNSGIVVGKAATSPNGPLRAFMSRAFAAVPEMNELGALAEGGASVANAVNDSGEIVGAAQNAQGSWRAFYRPAGSDELVDLAGREEGESCAYDINSSGFVVGRMDQQDGAVAFIWHPRWREWMDLNQFRSPAAPMRLVSAEAINEKGAISGWGSDQYGDDRAFVLIPVR